MKKQLQYTEAINIVIKSKKNFILVYCECLMFETDIAFHVF